MAGSTFFTNLMLRFGWGITGNQDIAAGRTVDQMGGSTAETFYDITGQGDALFTGYRLQSIGNPDLKWEENQSVNIGLDAELFEGRLSLDLDVYQRDTDNLLYNPALPATAGYAAPPIVNVGKIRNRGFDVGLAYRGTLGREINWNVNFTGAHYKNEILRIAGDQEFFFGPVNTRFATQGLVINKVGHPIGAFHGLVLDGFFQSQEEIDQLNALARQMPGADPDAVYQDGAAPGRFRFRDITGNGRVTLEDRTVIGDPHPDFTAGLSLGLQWRRWDFAASLFGTFGNDIFDVQKEFYVFGHFNSNVRRDRLTDSWTPDNPNAKYPRIDKNDAFSGPNISSFYVEDGSYVRLRSLQVGYTVPDSWIRGLGDVRVWVQGENLFTITGYNGLDPALPASNVSMSGMDVRDQARGIDRGVYPTSRMITVGFGIGY
jgi:TonB-dependent starch-binding outer membrane protein SusC